MYAELSAAIQSIKGISELVQISRTVNNYNEITSAVAEVNSKMMEAMAKALASLERQGELQQQVSALEKELADLRAWRVKAGRYVLHKFPPGSLAYALKKEFESEEFPHFICAKCFDTGIHTKLQVISNRYLNCFTCKTQIPSDFAAPLTQRNAGGSFIS